MQYQDTYGRIEVWEVEEKIETRKHLQWSFEFQWNGDKCKYTPETEEDCPILNLTSTQENAAYFEFRMAKSLTDSRNNPLIVVWYDLLNVPYALRPTLTDTFDEFYFPPDAPIPSFGFESLWNDFKEALIVGGVLLGLFSVVMLIACFAGEFQTKRDYMLDTRGYRCTFKHTTETLVIGLDDIKSRSRFSWCKHGPWLIVVLVARIAYMTIYTFTFFLLIFQRLNNSSFTKIDQYNEFAVQRDEQLVDFSNEIEIYYDNETDRLDAEVSFRGFWCVDVYSNQSREAFQETYEAQIAYHTDQMDNIFDGINLDLSQSDTGLQVVGPYGCNDAVTSGAVGRYSEFYLDTQKTQGTNKFQIQTLVDVLFLANQTVFVNGTNQTDVIFFNETRKEQRTFLAQDYDTNWANFSEIKAILDERCDDSCAGWGFYNNGTEPAYFQLFFSLGSPILGTRDGICYEKPTNFSSLFTSPDNFINYTLNLENEFELDYQAQIQSLTDTLTGLYDALVGLRDKDPSENNVKYNVNLDNGGEDYDVVGRYAITNEPGEFSSITLNIACPGCPDDGDNVTSPLLQTVGNVFNNFNASTLNETVVGVNASDLITLDLEQIDFPTLPTIELPRINFPLNLDFIKAVSFTLDGILMAYRIYKTLGILYIHHIL